MKKKEFEGIKNIIFDLGGVLLNINYHLTSKAFKGLGVDNFDEIFSQFKQNNISDLFETGKATENDFYKAIIPSNNIAREEFDVAWNAMLLDFPKERYNLIRELKKEFNLFLCSNTNSIHLASFHKIVNQYDEPFEQLFNKVYYSHKVGLRKPNKEIFECILQENNLESNQTLFIDDSIQHIHGAQKLGVKTIHLVDNPVEEIFADWLN